MSQNKRLHFSHRQFHGQLAPLRLTSFPGHWFIAQQKIEYAGDGSSIFTGRSASTASVGETVSASRSGAVVSASVAVSALDSSVEILEGASTCALLPLQPIAKTDD
mmetsp:Transcript_4105/g.6704  ORF Transcript_4105/g.6704 Transcript_4105/m.6704 type:complete len:106 (+) Transcript_4105:199-516(+)